RSRRSRSWARARRRACCRSASAPGGRRRCPRPDSPRRGSRWSAARRRTHLPHLLRRRSTSSRSPPSSGDRWTDGLAGQPLRRRLKTDSLAHQVTVRTGPETRLRLARGDGGWSQAVEVIPWILARVRVSGLIETSLYDALDKAMPDSLLPAVERRTLAWEIADVYDWEVDFTRDVHPGDRFVVLMERLESAEGERRFGGILA